MKTIYKIYNDRCNLKKENGALVHKYDEALAAFPPFLDNAGKLIATYDTEADALRDLSGRVTTISAFQNAGMTFWEADYYYMQPETIDEDGDFYDLAGDHVFSEIK